MNIKVSDKPYLSNKSCKSIRYLDQYDGCGNKLLVINHLNDPYTGGLGSFSLFLMLYTAYYMERINSNCQFHSEHTHTARLFTWFLMYFGEYFDMNTYYIAFLQDCVPFPLPKIGCQTALQSSSKLGVLDPFNTANNTTARAFNIDQIRNVYKIAKNLIYKEGSKIHSSTDAIPQISILDKILKFPLKET